MPVPQQSLRYKDSRFFLIKITQKWFFIPNFENVHFQVKSKLIELTKFSGKKASIYSIVTEDSKVPFFDHFIAEHRNEYEQDLISIAKRLRSIGNTVGARKFISNWMRGWNGMIGYALYTMNQIGISDYTASG